MGVCFAEDDFTQDRFYAAPRWEAVLTDGNAVIADDGRPGEAEPSAWIRLREYCAKNRVGVTELRIRFRGNVQSPLPQRAAAYFFVNAVGGWMGEPPQGFFLIGHQECPGGLVSVQRWAVPEMVFVGYEDRDPLDERRVGDALLVNP